MCFQIVIKASIRRLRGLNIKVVGVDENGGIVTREVASATFTSVRESF